MITTWDHDVLLSFLLPCPVEDPRLPESIKTTPKTSHICPQALQMVAKLSPTPPLDVPKCPNMCPGNPKTSPRRPQALSKISLDVPNH